MIESTESTWRDNWRDLVYGRLNELGYRSVSSFLEEYQGTPLYQAARILSPYIAAVQLTQLRFSEVRNDRELEIAAKDFLCRTLRSHLRKGWNSGLHAKRMMGGAYSEWLATMEIRSGLSSLRPLAELIWNELEAVAPPEGWLPASNDDSYLVQSVSRGLHRFEHDSNLEL